MGLALLKQAAQVVVVAAASFLSYIYWPGSGVFGQKDAKTGNVCKLNFDGEDEAFALFFVLAMMSVIHPVVVLLSKHTNQHSKYKLQYFLDMFFISTVSIAAVSYAIIIPLATQLLLPRNNWNVVVLVFSCNSFLEKVSVVWIVMSVLIRPFRLLFHTQLSAWQSEVISALVQSFLCGLTLYSSRLLPLIVLLLTICYANLVNFWLIVRCFPLTGTRLQFSTVMLALSCWVRTTDLVVYGCLSVWISNCPVLPDADKIQLQTSIGLLIVAGLFELKKNFWKMFCCF